jgi:cellulose synthase/poly-beta-1,6-N-acetylglucosamine synthase-like glycosyltransferase
MENKLGAGSPVEIIAQIILAATVLYSLIALFFLIGLFYPKKGNNKIPYNVTVVVAARNEEKVIATLLNDLINQTYDRNRYQILVANDGSTDSTTDIMAQFEKNHSIIKHINIKETPPNFSPKKYALQQAVKYADGEIILSTDADCRVKPEWIETMVSYFTDKIGFVIGFSQFGQNASEQTRWENLQAFDFLQLMGANAGAGNLGIPLAASGQNLAYRRKAYKEVKGYTKISHRVSGDDVLLLQLIQKSTKWKAIFAADRRSYTTSQPQPNLRDFLNQRKRWASNGSYQIKLNFPFFLYLFVVFINNASLLIGVPFALVTGMHRSLIISCFLAKALIEGLVALKSTSYFQRFDLLKYFPVWFFIQIPYVVIAGLFGTFGRFSWKGRQHAATTKQKTC